MIQKIKLYGLSFGVIVALFLSGAWRRAPLETEEKVTEAIARPDEAVQEKDMVILENDLALQENRAKAEYVQICQGEQSRKNAFFSEMYAKEEAENEARQKEREQREKERLERKKRKEEKRQQEMQILERIVEAEAGDQDLEGRILVANVIINRVKSKHFPDSVKEVVFANRNGRYQFSPVANGRYHRVTVSEKSRKAVKLALSGKDISNGALYFMCRSASNPKNVAWFDRDLTKVKEHGCHEFFK